LSSGSIDDNGAHADDGREALDREAPRGASVPRREELPVARTEVEAGRVERVGGQRVAQDRLVCALLRQPAGERLPRPTAVPRAVDAELPTRREAEGVGLGRKDVDRG